MQGLSATTLLGVWAVAGVLGWLARRDRRLIFRLPRVGAWVGMAIAALFSASRIRAGPTGASPTAAILMFGACALFSVPLLLFWAQAYARQDVPRIGRTLRRQPGWALTCLALATIFAGAYFTFGRALVERWHYRDELTLFEADGPLYVRLMRGAAPAEALLQLKHPLYLPASRGLYRAATLFLSPEDAPVLINALFGGAALGLAAAYFRAVTGSRLLAVLLAGVLGSTAAHLVFGAMPETYAMSAAGLILLHWLLARRPQGRVRLRHEVPAAVLATGATITHFFTALFCLLCGTRRRMRRFNRWGPAWLGTLALPLALGLALLPPEAWPTSGGPPLITRLRLTGPLPAAVWNVGRGMLAENVVGPSVAVGTDSDGHVGLRLGAYESRLAKASLAAWWLVLVIAITAIAADARARRPTLWAALACLGFSAVLHVFYGNAYVFLFSCTFTFYVIAIVAHGLAVVPRWAGIALIGGIGVLVAANNLVFCRGILERIAGLVSSAG